MAAESSDVGTFYGKYFLLKKLAAGGMGEVFLAKQQGPAGFEKILIIKKVLAHLSGNKEFIELFLGEARLAARMNHRNIVQVFELGEHESSYFIAMEYVQGKPLRDVIDMAAKKKEKLSAELCRSIAEQICDGASYAHNLTDISGRSLNIIHRDLNPQNVLISYTGDVKVIDFGIAKSEMSTVKTEAGMIKGKFVYMSPEQSLAKKLDKRSDIFAIGISLYEMLTGINPFHKNNIVLTLEAVQRFEPPPPSEYDPAFAPFDPIIAKALAKDRDRRYADAAEMQDDLRRITVPRAQERLGPFMSRIFRAQLEEEQKILMDTDSSRVTGGARPGGRTPSKPVQAMPTATVPEGAAPEGATMMLPPSPVKGNKGSTPTRPVQTPTRPAPRAPPAASKKPQGAGDTLMDLKPAPPKDGEEQLDEEPGGTLMMKSGQPAPARKPIRATDTMPEIPDPEPEEGEEGEEGGENKTAYLGTSPQRGAARKPPLSNGGSTNIMTPEESAAAQREALAKMQQAQGGAGPAAASPKPRPRPQAQPPAQAKKLSGKGKGLWIAIGLGGLVIVGSLVALLVFALSDDAPAPRRKKAVAEQVPARDAAPAEEKSAPVEEPRAPASTGDSADRPAAQLANKKKKPSDELEPPSGGEAEKKPAAAAKAEGRSAAAAGAAGTAAKAFGTLTLNPGPNVPVKYAGSALPKQVGAMHLPVTSDAGSIEVGDGGTQFKVLLEFSRTGSSLSFKVKSEPWAIASVDGPTRGKTPLADIKVENKIMLLELKKPGQETGMQLRLLYKPN